MRTWLSVLLAFVTLLPPALLAATAAPKPAPAAGFEAFRLLRTRNVFDPDRRAFRSEAPPPRPQAPPPASFISLTGTMVTAERSLAFFSGSRSDLNKVLPPHSSIADFKIAAISPNQVELDRAGKRFTVAVGQQLALDGSSRPTAAAPPTEAPAVAPPAGSPSVPGATPPGAPPPPAGDRSEVLRRMMERRQKEMSK